MNQSDFIEFVENPALLKKQNISDLKQLTKQHPYCATLQMLYAKALHNEKHLDYNKQLKIAAIYAGNRELLYNLIMKQTVKEKIAAAEEEIDKTTEQPETTTSKPKEKKVESTSQKEKQVEEEKGTTGPVEEEILREAITTTYMQELANKEPIQPETQPEEGETKKEGQQEKEEEPVTSGAKSFSRWLNTVEGKKERPASQNELIEKFVSKADELPAAKTEFFSPTNMAKMSLAEDDRFVTETLANIYYKQGDFERAIKAYQALSLKIPEKKSYFAALVKKAEEQLKNK